MTALLEVTSSGLTQWVTLLAAKPLEKCTDTNWTLCVGSLNHRKHT